VIDLGGVPGLQIALYGSGFLDLENINGSSALFIFTQHLTSDGKSTNYYFVLQREIDIEIFILILTALRLTAY